MTPIGKSTFHVGVGAGHLGAAATVARVGSGVPCDPDQSYISWYCPQDDTQVRTAVTCEEARLCPMCSKRWAVRQARKAAWRLKKVGERKMPVSQRSPRHVVVSYISAIDPLTPEGMTAHLKHAWKILRNMGAKGGVGIYHPWRHSDAKEGPYTAFWRMGVHSHWLIWGWLDVEDRPEYMFVRVIRSQQETIVGTLAYLLDHCGVSPRGHALRYYGIASYNGCTDVPPYPVPELDPPSCPECGSSMVRLGMYGVDDSDLMLWLENPGWRDRMRSMDRDYERAKDAEGLSS